VIFYKKMYWRVIACTFCMSSTYTVDFITEKNKAILKPFSYSALVFMGSFAAIPNKAEAAKSTHDLREHAVIVARSGHLGMGIRILKKLHRKHPRNIKVTSDLIVLLHQAGRNQEIGQLTDKHGLKHVADYALIPWASALRDIKRFEQAKQILQPARDRLGVKAEILYAMICAEEKQPQVAIAALPLSNPELDADDYAHIAYIYRLVGQPTDALHMSLQARAKNTDSNLAEQEAVLALFDLSVQRASEASALKSSQLLPDAILQQDLLNKDVQVASDFVITLRKAGFNEEIAQLTEQHLIHQVEDYAYIPWSSALRDTHRLSDAQRILKPVKDRIGAKAQILYAMISAESNQPKEALASLPLTNNKLDVDDYAHMAYVYRLVGQPIDALHMSLRARAKKPDLTLAIQESVFALSDLSSPYAAEQLATQQPNDFSAETLSRLHVNVTAQNLRDAIAERERLESLNNASIRNQPLDAVLLDIQKNITEIPAQNPQHLRSLYDQVYALRTRERMFDAIDAYERLPASATQVPDYVKRAAADAYLATHKPQIAAKIYQSLLLHSTDVPLFLGYYNALIDSEHYDQASAVLTKAERITPKFRTSQAIGGDRLPNWERLDLDQASAMNDAYCNHLDKAEQKFAELSAHAPRNSGILNNYATVLGWRSLPETADQTLAIAVAYDPNDAAIRLGIANNAQDLDQIPRWRSAILPLEHDFPDDVSVQKNYAALMDRNSPSITSDLSIGKSSGGNNINDVNGSRDRDWQTRINTPWILDDWRGFVQQDSRSSELQSVNVQDNRGGVGVEWSDNRKDARILVSGQTAANHVGVTGDWSQWLNDHWQYTLNGSTNSMDIPLQALEAGLSAKNLGGSINWQQNESLSAHLNLGWMGISDGNNRLDESVGMSQRILAGAHYMTTLGLDVYHESNSQLGGNYFNPARSTGESVSLQHQWITWRTYQHSLTQNFKLSAGLNTESGYGSDPTVDLSYQHVWQFSRTWSLNYGVTWGSHVYDGQREGRVAGVMGFGGVF
jgi:biofilm PGA synthesis protein PgaA